MQHSQYNIAVISDDFNRLKNLSGLLQDSLNKQHHLTFGQAFSEGLVEIPFDLVIVDVVSNPDLNFTDLSRVRKQNRLDEIVFIFILLDGQETIKRQCYKNPNNRIVFDPADRFFFISTVTNALHQSALHRSNILYQDIIEGEKKLISHMDELLEMGRVFQFQDEKKLLGHLEESFIRRLELALAVETAIFTTFDQEKNALSLKLFDQKSKQLLHHYNFDLAKSNLEKSLRNNSSQIFEDSDIQDPFILDLEEVLGIKIFSLLFIPVSVFHQPVAAIILVNKLYRDAFTENDLSFCLVAAHKITYHFEAIRLTKKGSVPTAEWIQTVSPKEPQSVQMYRHILDSVYFGSIVFDQTWDILYINPAGFRILNKKKTDKAGLSLRDLFEDEAFKQLQTIIEQGKFPIVREEMKLLDEQVPHFYIGFSVYLFSEIGESDRYILVFSEISSTKRIQAEIVRMDRMASLGALSSGIAHEIRNPLAGIKAMVQTLEEQLEEDELKTEYIQRILRQVSRLEVLLKSFFSYAKPVRPDPAPIHIVKVVEEVFPLIARKLEHQKIQFFQKYAPDLAEIFVDANQVQQVFLNLFLNAIDAMPKGGILEVKAINAMNTRPIIDRRNTMANLLSDSFLQILVKDSGKGISEKDCNKIFDPFYTTKSAGTGLGLSIVYQIIKEHGGRIDVQSVEDEGTEFVILLPAFINGQSSDRSAE